MKKLLLTLLIASVAIFAAKKPTSNLPLSQEASLVEVYSSSEITIKATGIGKKDNDVMLDLKRSAVMFVLKNSTDPILNTPKAKAKFRKIEEDFFKESNINGFISWSAGKYNKVRKGKFLPKGKTGFKKTKMVRVNTRNIRDYLVGEEIIVSKDELADAIGMPFLMVIPAVPKGQTPIQVLESNPLAKQAAAVIESFLTARKYDVVVPRASEQLNDMTKMQGELKGQEEDISYQLALSLGADVYIVYTGTYKNSKVILQVKAYETTTARLLGTETGYSASRPGVAAEALVEEAMNDAITNVLSRITNYWMDDVKKGMQYKVIFKIMDDLDEDQVEEVQEQISDLVDDNFNRSKENVVTDKTMDYLLWAKPDDFSKASKIYRLFKKEIEDFKIRKISINRKLVILGVYEDE